jgi:glutamate 5-kinase
LKGEEIALGLINYSATETRKILGSTSSEIKPILGYVDEVELINRKNLVLLNQ